MLAGLIQEIARQTVFWRDGRLLSKSEAMRREIERGSADAAAYALAQRLRAAGTRACVDHENDLRRTMASLAPRARAELARWMEP
jgi:hypothetical protein